MTYRCDTTEVSGFHHYDECVLCMGGRICESSTAHPNYAEALARQQRRKGQTDFSGTWLCRIAAICVAYLIFQIFIA